MRWNGYIVESAFFFKELLNVAYCSISRNLTFMEFPITEVKTHVYPCFKCLTTSFDNMHSFYLLWLFVCPLVWLSFLWTYGNGEQGWSVTKIRRKTKFSRSNAMVSVDCEMVLCEDGSEGLVRVCVVDRNLQVLMELFETIFSIKASFLPFDYQPSLRKDPECLFGIFSFRSNLMNL